jgi:uncharacterized membrane protein
MASFYPLSHWGRVIFLVLLTAVVISTIGHLIWQVAQPVNRVTGTVEAITEMRLSNSAASYTLSLRTEQDELTFVRLRNNGRILNYLLSVDEPSRLRVAVDQRQGLAVNLILLNRDGRTIQESTAPPILALLVALIGLFILLPLVRPDLIERRFTAG